MEQKYIDLMNSILPDKLQQEKIDHLMIQASMIAKGIRSKGWSKSHFAKMVNRQPSVISKWLSGTHNFTSTTLLDIQKVLGIDFFAKNEKQSEQTSITQNKYSVNVFNFHPDTPSITFGSDIGIETGGITVGSNVQIIKHVKLEQN